MKLTASDLRQIIQEVTQGEMEFSELEAAREDYLQDKNDETRYQFGRMVEKLVEPLMAEMGLFFEAEAFYNRGEVVFTNNRNIEVTIDPEGMQGGYDVYINPLYGAEDDVSPTETTVKSMKGAAQFVADFMDLGPEPAGMVGEPEAQTELPLENKMKITKSQLQQVIREALDEEMEDRISGKDMLAKYDAEEGLDVMSAEEAMEELDNILTDIRQTSTDARSAKQAYRAEDMLRVITRG
jgi:hypothetical protein